MKRMRRLIPPLALILNACHPFKHNKPCDNCRQHIPTDENVRGPKPPTSDQIKQRSCTRFYRIVVPFGKWSRPACLYAL